MGRLTSKERAIRIAEKLCMTPTDKVRVERSLSGHKHWWLLGCREGGQPLPMTDEEATLPAALDAAEAWLGIPPMDDDDE